MTAQEAEKIGLVNKVVPDDKLIAETYKLARDIANKPQYPIRFTKRAVYQGQTASLSMNLDMISSHMAILEGMPDHLECVKAFLNQKKRRPDFSTIKRINTSN